MENVELMEGLEILSIGRSMPIAENVVLIFFALALLLVGTYIVATAIWESSLSGIVFGMFFIGVSLFASGIMISETINSVNTYKVLVNDSVPMNEFYSKYEILNVEGKIYTIKPRGE